MKTCRYCGTTTEEPKGTFCPKCGYEYAFTDKYGSCPFEKAIFVDENIPIRTFRCTAFCPSRTGSEKLTGFIRISNHDIKLLIEKSSCQQEETPYYSNFRGMFNISYSNVLKISVPTRSSTSTSQMLTPTRVVYRKLDEIYVGEIYITFDQEQTMIGHNGTAVTDIGEDIFRTIRQVWGLRRSREKIKRDKLELDLDYDSLPVIDNIKDLRDQYGRIEHMCMICLDLGQDRYMDAPMISNNSFLYYNPYTRLYSKTDPLFCVPLTAGSYFLEWPGVEGGEWEEYAEEQDLEESYECSFTVLPYCDGKAAVVFEKLFEGDHGDDGGYGAEPDRLIRFVSRIDLNGEFTEPFRQTTDYKNTVLLENSQRPSRY